MKYNSLFNLLYSVRISEATKEAILSSMEFPITESVEISEATIPYIEFLDTLAYSNISEELTNSIIEEVFSELDEAFVEEIYETYIKVKSLEYISEDKPYVGLSGLRKEWEKRDNAAKVSQPSQSAKSNVGNIVNTAKEKVKSAVGKVKDWVKNNTYRTTSYPDAIDYKALRSAIGKKHNENQRKGESDFKNPVTVNYKKVKQEKEPEAETTNTTSNQPTRKQKINNLKSTIEKGNKVHKEVTDYINKSEREEAENRNAEEKGAAEAAHLRGQSYNAMQSNKSPVEDSAPSPAKSNKTKTSDSFVKDLISKSKGENKEEKPTTKRGKGGSKKSETELKEPVQQTLDLEAPKAEASKKSAGKGKGSSKKSETEEPTASNAEEVSKKSAITSMASDKNKKGSSKTPANSEESNKNKKVFIKQGELPQPKNTGKTKGTNSKNVKDMLSDIDNDLKKQKEGNVEKSSEKEESAYEKRLRRENEVAKKRLQDREAALVKELDFMKNRPGGSSANDIKQKEASLAEVRKNLASYEPKKETATANEALSEAICLLVKSNISESLFTSILEMLPANRENGEKVIAKLTGDIDSTLNKANNDLLNGKPLNKEEIANAEKKRERLEKFQTLFNKKFLKSNDNK